MTLDEFKAKYPDIAKTLIQEGEASGYEKGFAEGEIKGKEKASKENQDQAKAAGAASERERILAVKEQIIPGHEALVETLMFDGKTTGPEAAVKVLAAEKKLRVDTLAKHREDSPEPLPDPSTDRDVKSGAEKNLPVEERAKAEWEKDPKIRAEFAGDYDAFLAAEKAIAAGRVKIIGKK